MIATSTTLTTATIIITPAPTIPATIRTTNNITIITITMANIKARRSVVPGNRVDTRVFIIEALMPGV